MIKFIFTLLLLTTLSANASDYWDSCVSSDGFIKLESGEIISPEPGEEENYKLGELVKKVVIKTRKETCNLVNSKDKVISLDEETSYEEYNMNIGESQFKQGFLCVRGGSGIPANDSCDESTAELVETFHAQ
jgi:hypothetical protein